MVGHCSYCFIRKSSYCSIFNDYYLINTDLPIEKIRKCIGDPEADVENEVLKTEQEFQVLILIFPPLATTNDLSRS